MPLTTKDGGGNGIIVPPAPQPLGFEVTPDNVVRYGVAFQEEYLRLRDLQRRFRRGVDIVPWLGDAGITEPVSAWVARKFNEQFQLLMRCIADLATQFREVADELRRSAADYGKTEELNKALLAAAGPR